MEDFDPEEDEEEELVVLAEPRYEPQTEKVNYMPASRIYPYRGTSSCVMDRV